MLSGFLVRKTMMTKKIKLILGIVIILLGAIFYTLFWPRLQGYLRYKEVLKAGDAMLAPYKADTYGGKTPEETWDMFLVALNKGDLDLASKYVRVKKQEEVKAELYKLKDEGELDEQIKDWNSYKTKWHKIVKPDPIEGSESFTFEEYKNKPFSEDFLDGSGGIITKTMPAGYYGVDTMFTLNPYTNIWKLDDI